ncbi:MarR family winged helix-turn-helix transcriptional regulator [Stakelama pacifica]|uniref:Helix-turn-helix protein n=1 Tax=Stakelama pacifica TaxID=517720 RepID=A0A4R6FY23_9SPHN|nr:MarR family winged helix-turn-helix transcriptional regulator [Stakelama pacifica]TDN86841.1 hypothetical protein EV664_101419 [Stakelama pacifica]GGO90838.1 hypothetical protein GCM10011329_04130 [Stakelama pacifica]
MAEKVYSAPLPLHAIWDDRLAGIDLRVLACIAYHDRMSLATGKGQGCTASHGTIAAEIGCNYTNLSKAIKRLGDLGYIERHKPTFGDKRGHVYRVPAFLYGKEESLSFGQRSKGQNSPLALNDVGQTANHAIDIVGQDTEENGSISATSPEQYISLSDVRYSAKAENDTHHKMRDAEASRGRGSRKKLHRNGEPLHETLAKFERQWKQDWTVYQDNLSDWVEWLGDHALYAAENDDSVLSNWATRLSENVAQFAWAEAEIAGSEAS